MTSARPRLLAFAAVAVLAFAATRYLRAQAPGATGPGPAATTAAPPPAAAPATSPRLRLPAPPRAVAPAPERQREGTVERLWGIEAAIAADIEVAFARDQARQALEHSLTAAARRCAPAGIAEGPTQLRLEGTLRAGDELILLEGLTAPVVLAGAPVSDQVMGCIQAALPRELREAPRPPPPVRGRPAPRPAHYDGPVSFDFVFDDHRMLGP
jgi:hypothetical protein